MCNGELMHTTSPVAPASTAAAMAQAKVEGEECGWMDVKKRGTES